MPDATNTLSALISVSDKTGVLEFAQGLTAMKFRILSTGGTARHLRDHGISVVDVEEFTGSPEILGGRVKSLNPKIHAAILADRSNSHHQADLKNLGVSPIDIVIVNLYDFKSQAIDKRLSFREAIEFIDVGGPAMLRAAAKNYEYCLPVINPSDYEEVLKRLREDKIDSSFRRSMAHKVFQETCAYDNFIANYLEPQNQELAPEKNQEITPPILNINLRLKHQLRYGENPHQIAALYTDKNTAYGIPGAIHIQGKELSYNNYLDLDAAGSLVADVAPVPCMTIVKHTNPCGTAAGTDQDARSLFLKALSADPICAFGGIVASNVPIDESAATVMAEIFLECIIAPDYSDAALAVFRHKKNLRILKSSSVAKPQSSGDNRFRLHSIFGGVLAQTCDSDLETPTNWSCVTRKKPTPKMIDEMSFAMTLCKHVKSNAIVITSDFRTIGIGAGQMSRIDSVHSAISKVRSLGHSMNGAVLASDAFFPFRDCLDEIARSGIRVIIQPGGSIRDQESINAANEHDMIMMFTGKRHFKH